MGHELIPCIKSPLERHLKLNKNVSKWNEEIVEYGGTINTLLY